MKRFKIIIDTEIKRIEYETDSPVELDLFFNSVNSQKESKIKNSENIIEVRVYNALHYRREFLNINDVIEIYKRWGISNAKKEIKS
jgi:hypothetical protein